MYSKVLKKNSSFKLNFGDKFIMSLATKLKEKNFGPGEIVYKVFFSFFYKFFIGK